MIRCPTKGCRGVRSQMRVVDSRAHNTGIRRRLECTLCKTGRLTVVEITVDEYEDWERTQRLAALMPELRSLLTELQAMRKRAKSIISKAEGTDIATATKRMEARGEL